MVFVYVVSTQSKTGGYIFLRKKTYYDPDPNVLKSRSKRPQPVALQNSYCIAWNAAPWFTVEDAGFDTRHCTMPSLMCSPLGYYFLYNMYEQFKYLLLYLMRLEVILTLYPCSYIYYQLIRNQFIILLAIKNFKTHQYWSLLCSSFCLPSDTNNYKSKKKKFLLNIWITKYHTW